MRHPLLTTRSITEPPGVFVRRHATVIAEYGELTQDSGNISWLVEAGGLVETGGLVDTGGTRLFVKTAGLDVPTRPGAPTPYLDHAGRVRLLRNAAELARSCTHPALPRLLHVIESPHGPALVYEGVEGELVGGPREARDDPASAYQRFARLPADQLLGVLDVLVDLHADLAGPGWERGWVAEDLYDSSLILDFDTLSLHVVDLDSYHRGPSVNQMGRMFGSPRFMAPEELERGAVLDQRTTVFTLGRLAWHFGTRLTEARSDFCGGPLLADVVERACRAAPESRYDDVEAFARAWSAAR
jgi:serine/threonine protein kinase, bacterial